MPRNESIVRGNPSSSLLTSMWFSCVLFQSRFLRMSLLVQVPKSTAVQVQIVFRLDRFCSPRGQICNCVCTLDNANVSERGQGRYPPTSKWKHTPDNQHGTLSAASSSSFGIAPGEIETGAWKGVFRFDKHNCSTWTLMPETYPRAEKHGSESV